MTHEPSSSGELMVGQTWRCNSRIIWLGFTVIGVGLWLIGMDLFLAPTEQGFFDSAGLDAISYIITGLTCCYLYKKPALVLSETGLRINDLFKMRDLEFANLHQLQSVDGESLSYTEDQSANFKDIPLTGLRGEKRREAVAAVLVAYKRYHRLQAEAKPTLTQV